MRAAILVTAFGLAALAGVAQQPQQAHTDAANGRAAFITSGCAECHRVSSDSELPAAAPNGPILRGMSERSTTEISALITARSPSGSQWLEATRSGMIRSTGCTTLEDVHRIAVYLQARAQ